MRNFSDKIYREKSKHFLSEVIFTPPPTPSKMVPFMGHEKKVLLRFQWNNGYANASRCNVMCVSLYQLLSLWLCIQ